MQSTILTSWSPESEVPWILNSQCGSTREQSTVYRPALAQANSSPMQALSPGYTLRVSARTLAYGIATTPMSAIFAAEALIC